MSNTKKPKVEPAENGQRAEVEDRPITFEWDGEEWSYPRANATSMEFLSVLDDADAHGSDILFLRAMKLLLGREQADRLFKGRDASVLMDFFVAAGEAGQSGN